MSWPAIPKLATLFDVEGQRWRADWLAVAVAVSLPWSSSLTVVFIVLWLITLIESRDVAALRDEVSTAAGGLPVALWLLAAVGLLWAAVPLADRIEGLNSFAKLLAIPFLIAQFRRSNFGMRVLIGFLASCTVLLIVSWGLILLPGLPWRGRERLGMPMLGIPVKDYISQSTLFTLCIIGSAEGAFAAWRDSRRRVALALVLLALTFVANILYVATSRTALVTVPILLLLFGYMRIGWKGMTGLLIALIVLCAVAWPTSSYLRERVTNLFKEVRSYQSGSVYGPAGERLEFWRKSTISMAKAPVLGHGTGSIREEFRRSATDQADRPTPVPTNPHNQIFAIAIQLGLVGAVVLIAMWIAHLRLFWGPALAAGIGVAVVVQNVVSSLFNSALFDFTSGWAYVWGVGVLGGMLSRVAPDSAMRSESDQIIS